MKQEHHAHLWIGNRENLIIEAEKYLMKAWCKSSACTSCTVCKSILERQFYLLSWAVPEKQFYTVEQIEEIQYRISFNLEKEESFYVVFENTEAISTKICNKLLKTVEEPPIGYNFIFLTESRSSILPTLASRCIVKNFDEKNSLAIKYIDFIEDISNGKSSLSKLANDIEKLSPNERETAQLLKIIFENLVKKYKNSISQTPETGKEASRLLEAIKVVKAVSDHPPMPGSAKLFWRTLLLKMQEI